ncbi:MAG: helix-turn-helix domain-containing protein [Anaeromassilibacillus sp.]
MYDFGLRLKQLREKHNSSQSQVAKRLGITRAAISSYENNISLPSVNVLAELALLYRVSTDYLLGLDNRTAIVLEDLTPRQSAVIQEVMDTLVTEFKLSNRERSIKRQT